MSDSCMPDVDDITDALAQAAIDPQSVSVDGQSVTDRSADDKIKLLQHVAANTNSTGSAWGRTRFAKAVPPGGAPH